MHNFFSESYAVKTICQSMLHYYHKAVEVINMTITSIYVQVVA